MFTGIVTDVGEVAAVKDHQGSLKHIRIHSSFPAESIALGASIACSGPCLTVTAMGSPWWAKGARISTRDARSAVTRIG